MGEKKILIIEDDDTVREILEKAFNKIGYCVRVTTGAEEALELLKRECIPLIFVDIGLKKMNGFEFCELARKINPSAYIYALSGYAELLDPQAICQAGFNGFFSKPVSINVLFQVAEESFEKIQGLTRNPSV